MKHDTATAYIFSPDYRKILLVMKRIPANKLMPPGGHVEQGESYEEAVYREIVEETSILPNYLVQCHFRRFDIKSIGKYTILPPNDNEELIVLEPILPLHMHIDHIFVFTVREDVDFKVLDSAEIAHIQWYDITLLKDKEFYENVFYLIKYFSKCGQDEKNKENQKMD